MTVYRCFATAPKNMESLLAEELRSLGIAEVFETRAGANFTASLAGAYKICLWSRTANRVLLELARFPAATPQALYEGVQAVPWQAHFDTHNSFAVTFATSQSRITHSHFGALKVKDAIVDQFRERTGSRPDVSVERPAIQLNVYLLRDQATLSLDLSGESLHRRGYRKAGVAAPLKENLAAAILLRARWPELAEQGGALVDPMCGSGTLPIEAALMAADSAPGLLREYWGFTAWKQHHANVWAALLDEARSRRSRGLARLPPIRGYDRDPGAVRTALDNVERAGLHGYVHIERRELEACAPAHAADTGLVVVNPPYGERLGSASELPALYARLGRTLKDRFQGWHAAVFTGNPDLGKHLGLRAKRLHTLYNGRIECRLLHFEVTPAWYYADRPHPHPLAAEARSEGAAMFANRLQKNLKHLGRWARREGIHCYRLYDADLPEYALAIDVYDAEQRWIHAQEYQAPKSIDPRKARLRLREALGVILETLEISEEQLFFKVRRPQKGTAQYPRLASSGRFHPVQEGSCRFLVNFEDYLDTGLFLDHRPTRNLLAGLANGKHFLNLFAYTGTATVYAARGGARSTTSVDLSHSYLEWAKRNLALNGFTGPRHRFFQADCVRWLDEAAGKRRSGLIFLDPPTFSASKRMSGTFDVQRDHVALIHKTAMLLEADGTLIFSNNLRRFKMDLQALSDLAVEDITRVTLPKDFERNPRIHNCWKIRRDADSRNGA